MSLYKRIETAPSWLLMVALVALWTSLGVLLLGLSVEWAIFSASIIPLPVLAVLGDKWKKRAGDTFWTALATGGASGFSLLYVTGVFHFTQAAGFYSQKIAECAVLGWISLSPTTLLASAVLVLAFPAYHLWRNRKENRGQSPIC